jgi:uncharacterized protein (TIRG00374 family)
MGLHATAVFTARMLRYKYGVKRANSERNVGGAVTGLGIAAWSAEALALYALLHFMGFGIDLPTALFIYGFSLVIGGITLLPGGLGGAEVAMLQLLSMQNIPLSAAVAITVVIRLTTLWFSVLIGLIVLPKKQLFVKL